MITSARVFIGVVVIVVAYVSRFLCSGLWLWGNFGSPLSLVLLLLLLFLTYIFLVLCSLLSVFKTRSEFFVHVLLCVFFVGSFFRHDYSIALCCMLSVRYSLPLFYDLFVLIWVCRISLILRVYQIFESDIAHTSTKDSVNKLIRFNSVAKHQICHSNKFAKIFDNYWWNIYKILYWNDRWRWKKFMATWFIFCAFHIGNNREKLFFRWRKNKHLENCLSGRKFVGHKFYDKN